MLGPQLTANAPWPPNHHGNFEVAAGGIAQHASVVGDLVKGQQQKAHVHALDDRAQTRHGGPYGHASETVFGDRGVEHAQLAVLFVEVFGDLVGAAVGTDIFAQDKYGVVATHFFVDGLAQGVKQEGFCHCFG